MQKLAGLHFSSVFSSTSTDLAKAMVMANGEAEMGSSNLQRFIASTSPSISRHFLPKSMTRSGFGYNEPLSSSPEGTCFFYLADVWDAFGEWSAYGTGVPIIWNGREVAVQYYVPYLSALQLYTTHSHYPLSRDMVNNSDYQDTSSESSNQGETNKFAAVMASDDVVSSYESGGTENSLDFEFFESLPPYARIPLSDKISELGCSFPALKVLKSIDLLPSSWLSVAWYPIYGIPWSPILKHMSTSFLTYHSLSSLPIDSKLLEGLQQQKPSWITGQAIKAPLQPFGLASYKMHGDVWTSVKDIETQHAMSLQRCADLWVKQLRVCHPDYDYFLSHNLGSRHRQM